MIRDLSKNKGTYILLSRIRKPITIKVGKLGAIYFREGLYAYVGSAFGPGGIAARVSRHLRKQKKKFWHIDYFLDYACVEAVVVIESDEKLECRIAKKMAEKFEYVDGFGASDCKCQSHLFILGSQNEVFRVLGELKIKYRAVYLRSCC